VVLRWRGTDFAPLCCFNLATSRRREAIISRNSWVSAVFGEGGSAGVCMGAPVNALRSNYAIAKGNRLLVVRLFCLCHWREIKCPWHMLCKCKILMDISEQTWLRWSCP
jgi:hypothetical protein